MTQMAQPTQRHLPVSSNIFTVLLVVAFVVLAVGVAYLWWRHIDLHGEPWHPFSVLPAAGALSG